jgi:hypothetical protein
VADHSSSTTAPHPGETAGAAFDTSSDFWTNLQARIDAWKAYPER